MIAIQLSIVIVCRPFPSLAIYLTKAQFGTVVAYWLDYVTVKNLTGEVSIYQPFLRRIALANYENRLSGDFQ